MTTTEQSEPTAHKQAPDSYVSKPGELIDSAHNMPGDQPEDATPPPLTAATGDLDHEPSDR